MPCYDDAMRTIVEFPDRQISGLRDYCAREGVSRAEAVRRAVERLLADANCQSLEQIRAAAFGSWKELDVDSVDYVRQLRAEWDR